MAVEVSESWHQGTHIQCRVISVQVEYNNNIFLLHIKAKGKYVPVDQQSNHEIINSACMFGYEKSNIIQQSINQSISSRNK